MSSNSTIQNMEPIFWGGLGTFITSVKEVVYIGYSLIFDRFIVKKKKCLIIVYNFCISGEISEFKTAAK